MSVCFDVDNMNTVMEAFCPDGENVIAAVYGVGRSTEIIQYFGGCERKVTVLVPADNNIILKVTKKKVCAYDLYIGITEKSLIISECDTSTTTYYYSFDAITDPIFTGIKKLEKEIPYKSIGKAFPLNSIKKFEIKDGLFGSVKCVLTLDNGTFFKFMMAKRAGLGNLMPDHLTNRNKIIEVLQQYGNNTNPSLKS